MDWLMWALMSPVPWWSQLLTIAMLWYAVSLLVRAVKNHSHEDH